MLSKVLTLAAISSSCLLGATACVTKTLSRASILEVIELTIVWRLFHDIRGCLNAFCDLWHPAGFVSDANASTDPKLTGLFLGKTNSNTKCAHCRWIVFAEVSGDTPPGISH